MRPAAARTGVLCIGRVYCDLVFTGAPRLPTFGTEVFAEGLTLDAGGGAAITAAWLAALGRPAFLAAHLPSAPFDVFVRDALAGAGVDLRFCAKGHEPQVTVAITGEADRAFLTRRTGPVAPSPTPGALREAGIGHVHVGELATLREMPELIALARAADATLSLDCGWEDGQGPSAGLVAGVDVFLPNDAEMASLVARGLPPRPAPVTVIKRGADGATLLADGPPLHAKAVSAQIRDTTGAGDAFDAGFLHGWLDGRPAAGCLALATACGARAVAAVGGLAGAAALTSAEAAQ